MIQAVRRWLPVRQARVVCALLLGALLVLLLPSQVLADPPIQRGIDPAAAPHGGVGSSWVAPQTQALQHTVAGTVPETTSTTLWTGWHDVALGSGTTAHPSGQQQTAAAPNAGVLDWLGIKINPTMWLLEGVMGSVNGIQSQNVAGIAAIWDTSATAARGRGRAASGLGGILVLTPLESTVNSAVVRTMIALTQTIGGALLVIAGLIQLIMMVKEHQA